MRYRAPLTIVLIMALAGSANAGEPLIENGTYEITARLELPHLERWAVDRTTRVCIADIETAAVPLPVLSANNPFAHCRAVNVISDGADLRYDIVCPQRGAAKATAVYTLTSHGFAGHIAMTMGAKNMTMTEVQHGRRVGDCEPSPRPVHARQ